ncbi:glycoside hydrolase family 88 protein [Belliella sp. DSM 111904]|uniref:Glycoside hydrolase family 88 protein n=1 Tax=Belliella filtrata TaxID=2923435 RepID=A0ABS9UZ72_9BACT|nr:glycoside hydrolase family 88 protein [Belliella filtrata]MCH7409460.1 glycoside hydrolase family 88 protein [Belliella filtrata]
MKTLIGLLLTLMIPLQLVYSQAVVTDSNTPLHLLPPDYPIPYGKTSVTEVSEVLERVFDYLNKVTPAKLVELQSGKEVIDFTKIGSNTIFQKGDYRITSYEWGVTYAGMLLASQSTGSKNYQKYTEQRLDFLAKLFPSSIKFFEENAKETFPMKSVVSPHALDDAGALCAAMIKTKRITGTTAYDLMIQNFIKYISTKEYRLSDGTFARMRPLKNTLWLDDLFMSVPALAQYADISGNQNLMDDAVNQVLLFSKRMFNDQLGIYRHGWVEGAGPAPGFHWARANGWAFMAMVELLSVLPKDHPHYEEVLKYYQAHAVGLSSLQSGSGFWHQLLDKNDSYLETSATAIFTYGFAKGINSGWLDYRVYGPLTLLAWNAVASQVNAMGQVEGTCVGTGMGFDPAFYYHRPVNVFAAHSYGPVLLAGAEVILLLQKHPFHIDETAVQFKEN